MGDSFKNKVLALKQKLLKPKPSEKKTKPFFSNLVAKLTPKGLGTQNYRLAIWNTHIMSFIVFALLISNISLAIVVCLAYPLKTLEPMIIQAKGKDDVYITVTPVNPSIKGYDVLLETIVTRYITLRESIDLIMDIERWCEVRALSKPEVWKPFYDTIVGNKESYQKRLNDTVTRHVTLRNISRLDKDLFQIEWESTDKQLHEVIQRNLWVSILRFTIEPQCVKENERFSNPLGFFVSAYSVTRKDDK